MLEYSVEHHAEAPAGSSINEIIDFYWRKHCRNQGLDPDNLPPKKPPRYRSEKVCSETASGLFQIQERRIPQRKYIDPQWLLSPSEGLPCEITVWEVPTLSMKEALNQMEQEEVDVVIVSGDWPMEELQEALKEGEFAFSLCVVAECEDAHTTGFITAINDGAMEIAQRAEAKGFKAGILKVNVHGGVL